MLCKHDGSNVDEDTQAGSFLTFILYVRVVTITIRKASLHDLDTLLAFEQGLITAERPMDPCLAMGHINYYDIPALIRASQSVIMMAFDGDKPVGCGSGRIMESAGHLHESHYGHVGFMYVSEEYRGRGISGIIINSLLEWFREKGLREVRLRVYEVNSPAIKSYTKIGFMEHQKEMRLEL